jgi:Fur family ferric uptake transcriptional regulator
VPEAPATSDAEGSLRQAGLRVTSTRVAVFDALKTLPHARADEVFDRVSATLEHPSLQSVYNALGDFTAAGLVRRIEPAGHPGLFELRVDDNHHHLVCTSCGRVEDIDCTVGHAPCLMPSDTHGFTLVSAEVTFWGLCRPCADLRAARPSTASSTHPPVLDPIPPVTPAPVIPEKEPNDR